MTRAEADVSAGATRPAGARRRLSTLVLAAGVSMLAAAGAGTGTHAAAGAPAPAGFDTPTPSGIQGNGFEQDLRADNANNVIYTSAPQSLSSTTSIIWRSLDGGLTFKEIPAQVPPVGKPITCVGGGDSELAVDSGGHLYFNDLTLANFSTSRSDDRGTTFAGTSCTGVPDPLTDRQWYATHGDATGTGYLGLAYDRLEQANPGICNGLNAPSPTGNVLTLNLSLPGALAGVQFGPPQSLSCDEGIMGNDEMHDYGNSGGLKVFVVHDNAALNSVSMSRCDVVGISVTNPTGFAGCVDRPIASFPGAVTGGSFPTMSVDTAGNLFAVWEQAPGTARGSITGNTQLYFSTSTNKGDTWSTPALIPTPGLNQDVFAWPASGDPGRFDVAFYGTPAAWAPGDTGGPDNIIGNWSLYLAQTIDGGMNWTVNLASEHFIHHGTIQTLMGGQTGDRTLGDFLQLRLGSQGQALISYADSNNIDEGTTPEAMFVQQNSGPSVYADRGTVTGPAAPSGGCVTDPSGDASFDAASMVNAASPNLDLLGACVTQPDAAHYQFTMKVADLTSLLPTANDGGTDLVWQMQWHVPSTSDPNGGKLFMVYMESQFGQAPTCWVGQNATNAVGGGVELTYPGDTQLTGSACQYTATAPGTITITVPTSSVSEANPVSGALYSVTASTQTLPFPANFLPDVGGTGIGGYFPNLIDVAPAFDFGNSASNSPQTPETPWVPLVALAGASAAAFVYRRQRRGAATG